MSNEDFIRMLIVTNGDMNKLTEDELGRLIKFSALQSNFSRVQRENPILSSLNIAKLMLVRLGKNTSVLRNLEIINYITRRSGDYEKYEMSLKYILDSYTLGEQSLYIPVIPVSVDKLDLGGIYTEEAWGTVYVYERERGTSNQHKAYGIGRLSESYGLVVEAGLLKFRTFENKLESEGSKLTWYSLERNYSMRLRDRCGMVISASNGIRKPVSGGRGVRVENNNTVMCTLHL